jgi:ATP-dependent helicase HrpB
MLGLPVHPRLARMIAARPDTLSCILAALVDERDIVRDRDATADLAMRVDLVRRGDRSSSRVRERAADIARRAGISFDLAGADPDDAGAALLAGFPDRLAGRRRPGQFQLRTGSGAWVADDDPLAAVPFLVAADLDGKRSGARIRLGAAVDAADIATVLEGVVEGRRLVWEGDELVERVERRVDALRLGEERRPPSPGEDTTAALVDRVRSTRLGALPWTGATEQLRARVRFLHDTLGEPWPDFSDRALVGTLDEWLAPYLAGATGRADLDRLDLAVLLRAQLPWPLGAELDELAPATWHNRRIDYTAERPTVSVRVQQVFGVTEHPTIARGRVPLTIALLSPADRPIQVTADLPGFWTGSWAAVRKDLAGRYPKHAWPVDPGSGT